MDAGFLTMLSLLGAPLRARLFALLVARLPHAMGAGEIARALSVPPSTLSAHLAALSEAGLLERSRDGPSRFYRAAPERLGEALGWAAEDLCLGRAGRGARRLPPVPRLLFLCEDNAALSLMAEALARRRLAGRVQVASAGLTPAPSADPLTLALLAQRRHDLAALYPKPPGAAAPPDLVIALGPRAADSLPLAGLSALCAYWPLTPPPAKGPLIPRAIALHAAYRALNSRITALRRLPPGGLPRAAAQAALDDLSSGLPAAGHVCASRPAPRRNGSSRAPPASAAS
ncbi:helix-turn-helix domain-containing protein [Salipiger abyssi]|uniref:helix-turn-helix domain-containing protein n=1 Tax=Salipiger abyssi TaxID=1250539 RepID=UPI00405A0F56